MSYLTNLLDRVTPLPSSPITKFVCCCRFVLVAGGPECSGDLGRTGGAVSSSWEGAGKPRSHRAEAETRGRRVGRPRGSGGRGGGGGSVGAGGGDRGGEGQRR